MTSPLDPGAATAPDRPPALPLEFRVAVAGHRYLRDDPRLVSLVDAELQRAREMTQRAGAPDTRIGLTVVSPLAEGGDRIVARAGLRAGARLEVVLPLPPDDYCQDFATPESKTEFAALLAAADHVATVEARRSREAAYRRAGRALVDRSDVLLLLWDGRPARGVGGTAELVTYARRAGVPVRVIAVDPGTGTATGAVRDLGPEREPVAASVVAPIDSYNRWLAAHGAGVVPVSPDASPFERWFAPFLAGADRAALSFQRRFKAFAGLLFLLSAAAVVTVSAQIIFELDFRVVWAEVACLVLLLADLRYSRAARLLERWASCRYLAERLRSSPFLALVGVDRSLPNPAGDGPAPEPWVRRALLEVWCHGPSVVRPTAGDVATLRTALHDEWIHPQLDYHLRVVRRCKRMLRNSSAVANTLFAVSAVAALLHSTGVSENGPARHWISLVSVTVPAIGAAIHGYAALRDYRRLRQRSAAMTGTLDAAARQVTHLETLDELVRLALRVDDGMLGDSADWYTGTVVKELELAG